METQIIHIGAPDKPNISSAQENRTLGYQILCPSCGRKFFMTLEHANWYVEKEMEIPRKCPHCRKKAREDNRLQ